MEMLSETTESASFFAESGRRHIMVMESCTVNEILQTLDEYFEQFSQYITDYLRGIS